MKWILTVLGNIIAGKLSDYKGKIEKLRHALDELEDGTAPLIRIEKDEELLSRAKHYIQRFKDQSGVGLKTSLFPLIERLINEIEKDKDRFWYKLKQCIEISERKIEGGVSPLMVSEKYGRKILFILGLSVAVCGYLLSHEKEIPFVHKLYGNVNAMRYGFNKVCGLPIAFENINNRYRRIVNGDLTLGSRDEGFIELSELFQKDLKLERPEYFAKTSEETLSYDEFRRRALKDGFLKMTYQGIPGNGTGINIPIGNNRINVYLKDSPTEYASFFVYRIDEGIERDRRSITFWWSSIIFYIIATDLTPCHQCGFYCSCLLWVF